MKELAKKILRIAYDHSKPEYVRIQEIEELLTQLMQDKQQRNNDGKS